MASPAWTVRTGNQSLMALFNSLVDRCIAVGCLLLATLAWNHTIGAAEIVLGVITFALVPASNIPYTQRQPHLIRLIAGNWALVVGVLLLLGLVTNMLRLYDPNLLATWIIATPVVQACVHLLMPHLLPRLMALRGESVAVIVGANELGRHLARSMIDDPLSQTRIAGFFDDRAGSRLGDVAEGAVLGNIDSVAAFVRTNHVHQIFVALPMASQPRILKLLDSLRDTTASIYFVPDIFMLDLIQARVDTMVGMPVVAVCETPFHGTTGAIKRLSDLLIASAAIVLTAPVMLAIAIGIKMTMPGPVLFKQRRYGLDGRQIYVWKFRSMKVAEDGDNVRQATKDDDRITPFGRFLRRTSLDELPQFFNVLDGRMSVVGPRPHAVAHNEMYRALIKGYMIRHKVRPGITGWAQVNGSRGETDTVDKMQRRIAFDLEYLRNWSIGLDLKIILKTVLQVFKDPNAY